MKRRELLGLAGGVLLGRGARAAGLPEGALSAEERVPLAGKQALIKRTFRPPNYETPLELLGGEFTANDAFFVRYHLAAIPQVSADEHRLHVSGAAAGRTLSLSLAELRQNFSATELVAVCQCAGNRRGLFDPHVPGVQWGSGAMGNARWRGVRLRDVLHSAGVKSSAVEVAFAGADGPVMPATPAYQKSLPMDKALHPDTLLAWEMNHRPLPRENGFPLRLVAPGWVAAYWMKHLTTIEIRDQPLQSFWMKTAYRIPRGKFAVAERFPGQSTETTTPITEMVVNSLITSHAEGARVAAGAAVTLRGVAWDGGSGVGAVEIAVGGKDFVRAALGADHGRYGWRTFAHRFVPAQAGPLEVRCRARSQRREEQPEQVIANPAGYHNNAVQRLMLVVTALLVLLLGLGTAQAQESQLHLAEGPGRELVTRSCVGCHSLDYIQMNAPFLERKGWEAEVNKMIKAFGAPVADPDKDPIIDYLAKHYGKK